MGASARLMFVHNCCVQVDASGHSWALPHIYPRPLEQKAFLSLSSGVSDPLGYWAFEKLKPQLWVSSSSALRAPVLGGRQILKPVNAVLFR